MAYYLAPCLDVLRSEINQRWPRRDKASDGWIGDARHQASKSDHNPNERGSVNALDIDEDGLDFGTVFAAIKRHPSARYVIYERRLYHRLRGWRSEPYSGVNPHDKHFHLSIDQTRTAEQDRRPWGLLKEDDMSEQAERQIAELHAIITGWRSGMPKTPDGRGIEPVSWRIRDEDWQAKVTALLAALSGQIGGLDTEQVIARIEQLAADERQRYVELAELVQQAKSGELDAAEFVRIVGEKLATQAA